MGATGIQEVRGVHKVFIELDFGSGGGQRQVQILGDVDVRSFEGCQGVLRLCAMSSGGLWSGKSSCKGSSKWVVIGDLHVLDHSALVLPERGRGGQGREIQTMGLRFRGSDDDRWGIPLRGLKALQIIGRRTGERGRSSTSGVR